MNIFALDDDPVKAAQYHCNKHVVKMITESIQMMSTVHHAHGSWTERMMKPTHSSHPCTLWLGEAIGNWEWHSWFLKALSKEYTHRYAKFHGSMKNYDIFGMMMAPKGIPHIERTPFAQAMPDFCRRDNSVEAYRALYRDHKVITMRMAWFPRDVPHFMKVDYGGSRGEM